MATHLSPKDIDQAHFWQRCDQSGDDCWPWKMSKTTDGYGQYAAGGKHTGAHRVAWILSNAGTIPSGMHVLHRCDNPVCVRPDHLFLGTHATNAADMARKGRGRRGAGHLRERSPGRWEMRVSAGPDPNNARSYRTISRSMRGTKKEAQAALTALQAEVDSGRHRDSNATLATLLEAWMAMDGPRWSPRTLQNYTGCVRVHIGPALGHVSLRKLDAAMLDGFYAGLRSEGLSPSTVRQNHSVIRRALHQAEVWGWVRTNVARLASPGTVEQPEHTPPAPVDVLRLVDAAKAAKKPALAVLLRLAAASGARRGELCALRWRHVDLEDGELRIERSIIDLPGGHTVEKRTKTRRPRRVRLDPDTIAALAAWNETCAARAAAADVLHGRDSYIFALDVDGLEPWPPARVSDAFRRLRSDLGLAGVRLHDLRHFAATEMLAAGVPVKTVSTRLGHAKASTTLDVYGHALPSSDHDAAAVMGGLLASTE